MPCPTELVALLGTVPDGDVALRAGVSKQAVAKWRRALRIAACGHAADVAPPRQPAPPSPSPGDPATHDRLAYLESTLREIHADLAATGDQRSRASMYTAALKVRGELDELRKAESTTKTKAPEKLGDQIALLKKQCETLPDQLLVAVVEVYCARYRLDWARMLRAVGARSWEVIPMKNPEVR